MSLSRSTLIFGTMERERGEGKDSCHEYMTKAVTAALEVGYRVFDMAEIYTTQAAVGRALSSSAVRRDELFLISKLDGLPGTGAVASETGGAADYSSTKRRVLHMLEQVGVEYFDLLLCHYPLAAGSGAAVLSGDPGVISTPEKFSLFTEGLAVAWEHLSRLQQDGLVRHIGLSNCYIQHLEAVNALISSSSSSEVGGVPLAPVYAVQNYVDAAHHETDLLAYCQHHHIHCLAYRPLTFMSVYGFLDGVPDELQEISKTYCMESGHQLVLWWLLSRGVSPVISSVDRAHMKANYGTFIRYRKHFDAQPGGGGEGVEVEVYPSGLDEVMQKLAAESEMINMMGGSDEYALAFKAMRA